MMPSAYAYDVAASLPLLSSPRCRRFVLPLAAVFSVFFRFYVVSFDFLSPQFFAAAAADNMPLFLLPVILLLLFAFMIRLFCYFFLSLLPLPLRLRCRTYAAI